jgi:hypothetical protein
MVRIYQEILFKGATRESYNVNEIFSLFMLFRYFIHHCFNLSPVYSTVLEDTIGQNPSDCCQVCVIPFLKHCAAYCPLGYISFDCDCNDIKLIPHFFMDGLGPNTL